MAKVRKKILGTISGSIGPLTFADRKSGQVVYMKPDASKLRRNSVRVINTNTINFFISCLYNELFNKSLRGYWDIKKAERKGGNLLSMLMKVNCGCLYRNIPNQNAPLGAQNWMDMHEMRITYGYRLVEPILITDIKYKGNQLEASKLEVSWDNTIFMRGKAEDTAHIVAIYCKPKDSVDIHKRFDMKVYCTTGKREESRAVIETDFYEEPKHFTVFLFFSNDVTYSHSVGLRYGEKMKHVM